MGRDILWAAFLGLAAAICFSGCPKGDVGNKIVAVGSEWYGHAPVWVGIERGIFERHGFEVEWRTVKKSQDRLSTIMTGHAQFASLGEVAMLSAMSRDKKGFYWVGCQDIAPGFEGLVVREGITSFEDLRGKKIGFPFNSSVDLTCRILLRQNGLDANRDVKLVNLEVNAVPTALATGSIDAGLIWEPGFSKLRKIEGSRVLGMDTDTEVYKRFGTMTGPDVLILGQTWVDADPERARRFLKAYFEALVWIRDHTDEAAELIQGKYVGQDMEVLKDSLRRIVWHDLATQQDVMSDKGIFGQAEFVIDMYLNHIKDKTLAKKPAFREWVRMDLLKK